MSGGAREAAAVFRRWHAEADESERQALAALLGVSCRYGLAPFALHICEGRRWLLVTQDACPSSEADALMAWQAEQSDLAVIDTATGRAHLAGEPGAWLLGDIPGGDIHAFVNGLAWARAWARARAEALATYRRAQVPDIQFNDPPSQGLPGLLVAGQPERVLDWGALLGRSRVTFDCPRAADTARTWLFRAAGVPVIDISRDRLRLQAA